MRRGRTGQGRAVSEPRAQRGFTTRAIHAQVAPPVHQQPSSVPIYQSSTWRMGSTEQAAAIIEGERAGYVYDRGYGNPTIEAFEATIAELEGTEAAMAFSSGMSAIHAVLLHVARSGETVVTSSRLYGGTYSLFANVFPRYGIAVRFVDPGREDELREALRGARAMYVETIANPVLAVADLARIAAICAEVGVTSVVDNTFASPYLCNPASLGIDYVLHSATKYIGGHSDLIGGAVCTGAAARAGVRRLALDQGGAMAPFEAWLCLRGLATLALRMERHCSSAESLADRLAAHPMVRAVRYPGRSDHPVHATARRQLRRFGGMLCFEHAGGDAGAARFCDALRLAWLAVSLGGAHTLVSHPASTTHRQLDAAARLAAGLPDGLVRVSVGLEDPGDLIEDFLAALDASSPARS
jgi:cystathionine beta-lyase/cystathionine gamma-synthase